MANKNNRRSGTGNLGKRDRQPRTPEEQLEIDNFVSGSALKTASSHTPAESPVDKVELPQVGMSQNDMMAMFEKMTHAARPQPIQGRMVSMEQGYHDLIDELTFTAKRAKVSRSDVIRAGILALSAMSDEELEAALKTVAGNSVGSLLRDKRYIGLASQD